VARRGVFRDKGGKILLNSLWIGATEWPEAIAAMEHIDRDWAVSEARARYQAASRSLGAEPLDRRSAGRCWAAEGNAN